MGGYLGYVQEAAKALQMQFENGSVEKVYAALCRGTPKSKAALVKEVAYHHPYLNIGLPSARGRGINLSCGRGRPLREAHVRAGRKGPRGEDGARRLRDLSRWSALACPRASEAGERFVDTQK